MWRAANSSTIAFHRRARKSWRLNEHQLVKSLVIAQKIVALAPDGRSQFYDLLFRRQAPHFIAFDALAINGLDLRDLPFLERKRRLRRIMPSRTVRRGCSITTTSTDAVSPCSTRSRGHDLEGVVAKWKHGRYHIDRQTTSWLKVRHPTYSQMDTAATCSHPGGRPGRARYTLTTAENR